MNGVVDEPQMEAGERRQDTELTLGPVMLLGIFFVLVLLCGLSFGAGYAMGHRAVSAAPVATVAAPVPLTANSTHSKPTANLVSKKQSQPVAQSAPASNTEHPQTASLQTASSPSKASAASEGLVHPALPAATLQPSQGIVRPALPSSASTPRPPYNPASNSSVSVQIGTFMLQEDADMLVAALRKRGYPVGARRDAGDNLLHVRVGPFTTQDQASQWRQKLLNDGYNAVIQP